MHSINFSQRAESYEEYQLTVFPKNKIQFDKFSKTTHNGILDEYLTLLLPNKGYLYLEIKDLVTVMQDKTIIMQNTISNDMCRKCNLHREIVRYITDGYLILAENKYLRRYNQAGKIMQV